MADFMINSRKARSFSALFTNQVVNKEKIAATNAAIIAPTDDAIIVICTADKEVSVEWIFWTSIGFAIGASLESMLFG